MRGFEMTQQMLAFFEDTIRSSVIIAHRSLSAPAALGGLSVRSFPGARLTPWIPAPLHGGPYPEGSSLELPGRSGNVTVVELEDCSLDGVEARLPRFLCRNWNCFKEESGRTEVRLPYGSWFRVAFSSDRWFVQSVASPSQLSTTHSGRRIHSSAFRRGERRHPTLQTKGHGPDVWSVLLSAGQVPSPKMVLVDEGLPSTGLGVTCVQLLMVDEKCSRDVYAACPPTAIDVLGLS
jgi:hypothetical protein